MVGARKVESEHGFFTALESALICGSMWGKMSHCISPPTLLFAWNLRNLKKMTAYMSSDVMNP